MAEYECSAVILAEELWQVNETGFNVVGY